MFCITDISFELAQVCPVSLLVLSSTDPNKGIVSKGFEILKSVARYDSDHRFDYWDP